jgi:hypothetical protein
MCATMKTQCTFRRIYVRRNRHLGSARVLSNPYSDPLVRHLHGYTSRYSGRDERIRHQVLKFDFLGVNRNLRVTTVSTVLVALGTLSLSACSVTTSTPQLSASTSPTKTAVPIAARPFCEVQMPASWKSAITSGKVVPDGTWSMITALAPVGNKIVKEVLKGSVAHLELGSPGGKQQIITNIANTQAGGFLETVDFDGRWVVYVLGYDQQIANPWAIFAWDSKSGTAPKKIASKQSGAFMTGDPQVKVQHGNAIWIAGSTTTPVHEVHLFDLATSKDRIVGRQNVGIPFIVDNLLVWPETKSPMSAYDIVNGHNVGLPDALNASQNNGSVAGDKFNWAWIGGSTQKQVWMWRTAWGVEHPLTPPRKIFDAGEGGWISGIQLAGEIVTWSGDAAYAADLRSGSYVKFAPQWGASMGKGTRLAFVHGTTTIKSQYMSQVSYVLDVSKIPPLPTCSPIK